MHFITDFAKHEMTVVYQPEDLEIFDATPDDIVSGTHIGDRVIEDGKTRLSKSFNCVENLLTQESITVDEASGKVEVTYHDATPHEKLYVYIFGFPGAMETAGAMQRLLGRKDLFEEGGLSVLHFKDVDEWYISAMFREEISPEDSGAVFATFAEFDVEIVATTAEEIKQHQIDGYFGDKLQEFLAQYGKPQGDSMTIL